MTYSFPPLPTRAAANSRMLRAFRLSCAVWPTNEVRKAFSFACVDITPVAEWISKASDKEIYALLSNTPIRPPFDFCILGCVVEEGKEWRDDSFTVSRCTDVRWLSVAEAATQWKKYTHIKLDDRGLSWPIAVANLREDGTLEESASERVLMLVACSLAMFHVRNIGLREVPFPRYLRRRSKRELGDEGPRSYHTLTLKPFGKGHHASRGRVQTGEIPLAPGTWPLRHLDRRAPRCLGNMSERSGASITNAGNPLKGIIETDYRIDPGEATA
jgi:hypothetical protein